MKKFVSILLVALFIMSLAAVATAEIINGVVYYEASFTVPSNKTQYGPSTIYQKRTASSGSKWNCFVYAANKAAAQTGSQAYVYARNAGKQISGKKTLGYQGPISDGFDFSNTSTLNTLSEQYKVVVIKPSSLATTAVAYTIKWHP